MRVLVTGSSGYIGKVVVSRLVGEGHRVFAGVSSRSQMGVLPPGLSYIELDLRSNESLWTLPRELDAIVHLGGIAHRAARTKAIRSEIDLVNRSGSHRLAEAAAQQGVKKFVLISTLGVHGSELYRHPVIDEDTLVRPSNAYEVSKWAAERSLIEICSRTNMLPTIIRPALVVGPNAPGNLARLTAMVKSGFPIPIPTRKNARAFVVREDLAHLISLCLTSAAAEGQVLLAADSEYPSTKDVCSWIGEGLGTEPRFVEISDGILKVAMSALLQRAVYTKMYKDLRVNADRAVRLLDWQNSGRLRESFAALGSSYR